MNRLYKMADKMTEADIEKFFEMKVEERKITIGDIEKIKNKNYLENGTRVLTIQNVKDYIRKNQLVGCEWDPTMYALGCSNMILRGDGKSNILHDDCMKKENDLKKFKATVGMMNPPYSDTAYSIIEFIDLICKTVKKGSNVAVIVPTSAAHSDDFVEMRSKILRNNTLIGSMSMSLDLFKGIAGTITCILVFKAGIPHDYNKNVYFGNWKEDGYYWSKAAGKGMIPDYERKKYPKTPDEYKKGWLNSFRNINIDDEYGIWRKLTVDDNDICKDEWMWEYFVETDYSKLTKQDFERVVKKYVLFQLHQMELEELNSKDNMEE